MDNIHCHTILGVRCYHLPWKEYRIGRCRALHVLIAFGYHTLSEDVGRGMPTCPMGSTHGWMISGMGCHHSLWKTYMTGRDRQCYAIIAIGKHTRLDDVGCDMSSLTLDSTHCEMTSAWYAIIAVGQHIRLENVRRGIPSRLLSRTNGHTTSGVAVNHRH